MSLSASALIVIVLVGCLAATALGAGLFMRYHPDGETSYSPNNEQKQYLRHVREQNYKHLRQESRSGRIDLESQGKPNQKSLGMLAADWISGYCPNC
ncbi:hypothetical protein N7513_003006 [Penicillium frequentans]|nr:hypothetical protein N7513_003006 [Penicillium glabrum]